MFSYVDHFSQELCGHKIAHQAWRGWVSWKHTQTSQCHTTIDRHNRECCRDGGDTWDPIPIKQSICTCNLKYLQSKFWSVSEDGSLIPAKSSGRLFNLAGSSHLSPDYFTQFNKNWTAYFWSFIILCRCVNYCVHRLKADKVWLCHLCPIETVHYNLACLFKKRIWLIPDNTRTNQYFRNFWKVNLGDIDL